MLRFVRRMLHIAMHFGISYVSLLAYMRGIYRSSLWGKLAARAEESGLFLQPLELVVDLQFDTEKT